VGERAALIEGRTIDPPVPPVRRETAREAAPAIESRRNESDSSRENREMMREPLVARPRLEAITAARFAAVATSEQYRLADLDTVVPTREREGGSRAGGIRDAQRESAMKNSTQKNQIAGSREQILPGSGNDALSASSTPESVVQREQSGRLSSHGEAVSMAMGSGRATGSVQGSGELPPLSGTPLKVSEQLLLTLNREVMQFKSIRAESMAVVLKPDTHTEIFLHLSMRNGGIDVQARFDRGDFSALNSQWTQLQQTMQQQGVRLSSLQESLEQRQDAAGDSPWGQGERQSQKENRSAEEHFIESIDEKLILGSPKEPEKPPTRTVLNDLRTTLEAWA